MIKTYILQGQPIHELNNVGIEKKKLQGLPIAAQTYYILSYFISLILASDKDNNTVHACS